MDDFDKLYLYTLVAIIIAALAMCLALYAIGLST